MLKDREGTGHIDKTCPTEIAICAGCSGKIVDRYYLRAVDRPWHSACLKCCECKLPLETELSCFSREGNIYCKEDYYRMFSLKRCTRCLSGISANELVMRAKDCVYHLHCFVCSSCGKAFTKGEQFGMRDGLIYCRYHYQQAVHPEYYDVDSVHFPNGQNSIPSFYNAIPVTGPQKGRPRKRKGLDADVNSQQQTNIDLMNNADLSSMDGMTFDSGMTSPGTGGKHQGRTKRMRTSFKHHQLRTMKSYFALNQNPDAKDLKQLAQKTGLSKRVLQVWFQNARAKWRRTVMRQEGQNGSSAEKSPIPNRTSSSRTPPISSNSVSPSSLNELLPDTLSNVPSQPQFTDIALSGHQDESQSLSFSELYG